MAANPCWTKKMISKKNIISIVLLALIGLFGQNVWAEEINIYYSNDMHGKVEPCG